NAATIAVLVNPNNPSIETQSRDSQAAATALGLQLHVLNASTESEIDAAFATLVQRRARALLLATDVVFNIQRDQIIALAARYSIPALYTDREYAAARGLMAYGSSLTDSFHLAGVYTGRVLKGEKPADLPVVLPTKFELVINLKTAKALGLEIPPKVLAL